MGELGFNLIKMLYLLLCVQTDLSKQRRPKSDATTCGVIRDYNFAPHQGTLHIEG